MESSSISISSNSEGEEERSDTHFPVRRDDYVDRAGQATLVWKDMVLTSKPKRKGLCQEEPGKVLLHGVSGKITGGFWAIMGPSGGGKTTLLNSLACRLDRGMELKGERKLNGRDYSLTQIKASGGYVMQDDILNAYLTCDETLSYNAKLRLPPGTTDEEIKDRIEEVLGKMGLTHVRNVIVGSPTMKGISGGERKRLCVAIELLRHPKLLFLDEPTSGLDSLTALNLVQCLKDLVTHGECIIICTIHQPQARIFGEFDNLILLNKGSIIYSGPTAKALDHFESIGYPCPDFENPADFLMDTLTAAFRGIEKPEQEKLSCAQKVTTEDLDTGSNLPAIERRKKISWFRQVGVLFHRALKAQLRQHWIILIQLLQATVMGVLVGTAYLEMGHDQYYVKVRNAMLQFNCISMGFFGGIIVINSFPGERVLILRERAAGTYQASAYFVAKNLAEGILHLLVPIFYSIPAYWLAGLQPLASKFFLFTFFLVLCNFAAISIALCISAYARTTDIAVNVLPLALEICRIFGGFFLPPIQLPGYFVWLDALSYVKYSYVGIAQSELHDLVYNCTSKQLVDNGNGTLTCPTTSGEQVIRNLGLDFLSIGGCIGVLIGYIIGLRFIAYLGIRYIKW